MERDKNEPVLQNLYEPQGIGAHFDIDTASSTSGSESFNSFNDQDSSLGSDGASSRGSASVSSSIRNYRYENGRTYHAYRDGKYHLPNDEEEQERLDLHHHIHRLILGGKLYRSPIPAGIKRVLDYGTGTGIWAMDFADAHPETEVIGTDLSPIQPDWIPPNCKFYVDDVESDWTFGPDEAFDFIHGRSMCGSIADFDGLYRNCYATLKPGGWIEVQEFEAWIWQIDDPENKPIKNIQQWLGYLDEASTRIGKRLNAAPQQKQKLIDAGFVNVKNDVYNVPVGPWPKDPKMKELGHFQRENMILCVEAFTLALFTRVLDWSVEECQIIIAKVKSEFRDRDNHLITYFHFIYGQKPPLPGTAQSEAPRSVDIHSSTESTPGGLKSDGSRPDLPQSDASQPGSSQPSSSA